jgi:hypothetical protein
MATYNDTFKYRYKSDLRKKRRNVTDSPSGTFSMIKQITRVTKILF